MLVPLIISLLALLTVLEVQGVVMTAAAQGPIYVRSPEIADDGRVTLRYYAPTAKSVEVAGNVTALNQKMARDPRGVWSVTVGPLPADSYPYRFVVDDAVVIDPVNRDVKGWLWLDNLVHVTSPEPAIHQVQAVPHGQVHMHWYESPRLKQSRRLFVYTPPGYKASSDSYPVLYLFHGCGDDESAWTQVGQVQHLADNLLAAGKASPMVIVMPFGHDVLPTSPDFDRYDCMQNLEPVESEFFAGVIPVVEAEYRLRRGADHRAIAGLSMGGGQALRLGLTRSDQFHWIAGFSAAIKKHNLVTALTPLQDQLELEQPWIWLGCGTQDFLFDDTVAFDQWLSEHQIEHTTVIDDGNHNWRTWRGYLQQVLPLLFR